MKGQVKWFSPDKGYGFIAGQDGKDYFVHYSDIVGKGYKNLEGAQEVAFEAEEDDQGRLKAAQVEPLARAECLSSPVEKNYGEDEKCRA